MKDENKQIRKDFSARINNLEQRTRINNIEIVGLRKPTLLENDANVTVDFLNEHVQANVSREEIEALHEVPSNRKDKKRVVIVHFKWRARRDQILASAKIALREYNKERDPSDRIFINEHLSPENKRLFAMATKRKHELGYKYVWSKKGIIFIKKDDSSKAVKVVSDEVLAGLV